MGRGFLCRGSNRSIDVNNRLCGIRVKVRAFSHATLFLVASLSLELLEQADNLIEIDAQWVAVLAGAIRRSYFKGEWIAVARTATEGTAKRWWTTEPLVDTRESRSTKETGEEASSGGLTLWTVTGATALGRTTCRKKLVFYSRAFTL